MPELHANTLRVVDAAAKCGLDVDVATFPDGTRTASDAAAAIGCRVDQIVKSLVFTVDDEPVLALVNGADQLDLDKLATAAGGRSVGRADADLVRSATGFPIGGVAPFGIATPLRIFIDAELLEHDEIWAAAGTPMTVFRISPPSALVDGTAGTIAVLVADKRPSR